jgi:murein DD-endopeptidase MepM/ murein hydrolase activator NlpD
VRYFLATLIIILVGLYRLGSAPLPQTQIAQVAAAAPTNDREAWGMAFLAAIGNAAPTADTLAFVVAWQAGENTTAAFNPLATTQPAEGDSCFNYLNGRCGVRNYPDYNTGLQATVETLTNGYYQHIWYGLQNNQPEMALNDELGTWGTGKANVEANWARQQAPVQQVFATGAKHGVTDSMKVGAAFDTVSCDAWGNQPNCQHFGDDMQGGDNDPVYAPLDGTWVETNEYLPGDPNCPRCLGQYVRYVTADGHEMYLGHLKDAIVLQSGQAVQAGTVVGRIRGDLAHTHWQCRAPDGSLEDCISYYNSH